MENKDEKIKEEKIEEKEVVEETEKVEEQVQEKQEDIQEEKVEEKQEKNPLEVENEELKNQLLRLKADFVNFKNRTEREKSNALIFANESLILKLLPVVDNFERAFGHLDKEDEVVKGFVMIKDLLVNVLKGEQVEEILSDGEVFDPNIHNAIMMEEKEGVESGIVLETFEKGYKIKEKVIRPSMVKVSQ